MTIYYDDVDYLVRIVGAQGAVAGLSAQFSRAKLYEIGRDAGIRGLSGMNKADLAYGLVMSIAARVGWYCPVGDFTFDVVHDLVRRFGEACTREALVACDDRIPTRVLADIAAELGDWDAHVQARRRVAASLAKWVRNQQRDQ